MGRPLSRFCVSAGGAALIGLSAMAAWAQGFAPAPGADQPYTLKVEIRAAKDDVVLAQSSVRCKSMLVTCESVLRMRVNGRPVEAWVHGRAFDGRHLQMRVEPPLTDAWFERIGFHDKPAARGQAWEGKLIHRHGFDYDPKWSAAQREAAQKQPPTVIGKVLIRIEE